MIIDCHVHLGHNYSAENLLASMDEAKIDRALVFANEAFNAPLSWVLEQCEHHTDRLLVVADAHPTKGGTTYDKLLDAERLATLYDSGKIAAVKFYTGYEHYFPGDTLCRDYLRVLEEVRCPAIFHSGDCLRAVRHAKLKYAQPLLIDEVAVDYPNINFIIAHLGYPWHRDTAQVCYKNKNVYADISGFVYGGFASRDRTKFHTVLDEFLDIADGDKLLFGTGYPISNQASYIEALEWISEHTLYRKRSETFTPQYMTQNTQRAFNLTC